MEATVFDDLISEIISYCFCYILFVRGMSVSLVQKGEDDIMLEYQEVRIARDPTRSCLPQQKAFIITVFVVFPKGFRLSDGPCALYVSA